MLTCSGYWPPEYLNHQIITKEFDIFSLGVIITKIMTGREGYSSIADMRPGKFVKHVRLSPFLCQFQSYIPKLKTQLIFPLLSCIVLIFVLQNCIVLLT